MIPLGESGISNSTFYNGIQVRGIPVASSPLPVVPPPAAATESQSVAREPTNKNEEKARLSISYVYSMVYDSYI